MEAPNRYLKKQLKKQLQNFLAHIKARPNEIWIEPIDTDGREQFLVKTLPKLGLTRSRKEPAMWGDGITNIVLSFKVCFHTSKIDFTKPCFWYNGKP